MSERKEVVYEVLIDRFHTYVVSAVGISEAVLRAVEMHQVNGGERLEPIGKLEVNARPYHHIVGHP